MGIKTVGKRENGQNLVEFALILPLFLLLVVGMAEFGRAWMTRNILTGAAREGARVAAIQPDPATSINKGTLAANDVLNSANLPAPPPVVSVDPAPGLSFNAVEVVVTYTYSILITGFIPGLPGSFGLTGTATMRRERY